MALRRLRNGVSSIFLDVRLRPDLPMEVLFFNLHLHRELEGQLPTVVHGSLVVSERDGENDMFRAELSLLVRLGPGYS